MPPPVIVLAGPAGSGKSTVARRLTENLDGDLYDGDEYHRPENKAKMSAGHGLTDEERQEWLQILTGFIRDGYHRSRPTVVACSALKAAYRQVLAGAGPAQFFLLCVPEKVAFERVQRRKEVEGSGHFFPASLVHSQFKDFEWPGDDERVTVVDGQLPPLEIVGWIMEYLKGGQPLTGWGGHDQDLSPDELRVIVNQGLEPVRPGARLLAIAPDASRDDNTDLLFPLIAQVAQRRGVDRVDVLIASGTHEPMTDAAKRSKIGARDGTSLPALGQVYDHHWDRPAELVPLGELSAARVRELTGGLVSRPIPLRLNRLLAPGLYDAILVLGATVPHEVAGFSGGDKYFFPGVAGPELIHETHWLAALAGIEHVIGRPETPVRRLIQAAVADCVKVPVISFNSVLTRAEDGRLRTHALFAGEVGLAFRRAARVSSTVHVKWVGRKYSRVVALLDEHYRELWVGGKASYKLGTIIEDGGELIIYAPHMTCISKTHGALIERYGYAPLEKVQELVGQHQDLRDNLTVAAHLAHVTYASRRDAGGRIVPRYRITLASAIDEGICRRVNLGFLDPGQFRLADYESDLDTLIVQQAGRDLYLVE